MLSCESSYQIYDLAKKAKERLRRNDYSLPRVVKTTGARTFSDYVKSRHEETKVTVSKPIKKTEDEMYVRVCELLSSGCAQNPVLSLIDKEFFETLDSESKQFYIANLTQKFKFLVKRYYREHI